MSYGLKLRKCRQGKQLTQRELAGAMNVHSQYLSDIERGKRVPGLRLAIKLRDFFNGELPLDDVVVPAERQPDAKAA